MFSDRYLFHCHTTATDGKLAVEDYFGFASRNRVDRIIFLEHVRRIPSYDCSALIADVAAASKRWAIEASVGFEAKLLPSGCLDIDEDTYSQAPVVGIAEHSFPPDVALLKAALQKSVEWCRSVARNKTLVWVHPGTTFQKLGRNPSEDHEYLELVEWARCNGVLLEVNPHYGLLPQALAATLSPESTVIGANAHRRSDLQRWLETFPGSSAAGRTPVKRKIAHLTSVHDAGDARIAHLECATLAHHGYDVVLIAKDGNFVMPPGVRHRRIPPPRNRFERLTRTAWAVYRAARDERADFYHFHDPELIPVGIALRASGKPVFFDAHEDVPADLAAREWIWWPLRPIASTVARSVLRTVQGAFSAIVAATPEIERQYPRARTVLVQNYPVCEELSTPGSDYYRRPPYALYMGEITRLRGARQLVEAMADPVVPQDAKLLLVGSFEDARLRGEVSRLPGWGKTIAYGHMKRTDLPTIISRSRIGLLPLQPSASHAYALPRKLLEYMAAGLPVVASSTAVRCREIVESTSCGILVDPRDPAKIAAAIAELLSNPRLAAEMGARGRAAVSTKYNWSQEAPKLLALYTQ